MYALLWIMCTWLCSSCLSVLPMIYFLLLRMRHHVEWLRFIRNLDYTRMCAHSRMFVLGKYIPRSISNCTQICIIYIRITTSVRIQIAKDFRMSMANMRKWSILTFTSQSLISHFPTSFFRPGILQRWIAQTRPTLATSTDCDDALMHNGPPPSNSFMAEKIHIQTNSLCMGCISFGQ